MRGKAVEFVFAELQQVVRCDDPANRDMDGSHVVAVRMNMGDDAPSEVLIVSMAHALALRDDINRVLAEHAELTGDDG